MMMHKRSKKLLKTWKKHLVALRYLFFLIVIFEHEFSGVQAGLHLLIGTGIEALQTSFIDMHETLMSHINDHDQSHSWILQIQKGQQDIRDQLDNIQIKQTEAKLHLSEIGLCLFPVSLMGN
jgi:hypothetical protein